MPFVLRRTPATMLGALAVLTAPVPALASGPATYSGRCQMCHQANGTGTAQFPRLGGRVSRIAATPAGRSYLIEVVLFGMFGSITVDGKPLVGVMPAQGSLSDQDVADVLNHVASLGGGKARAFTPKEVSAVRAAGKLSAAQVGKDRAALPKGVLP